ncbi:MAG: thiamine biosynthesis protein ApbE [Novosphingobium sp. 12-64-8]|nr:MAG: thiamine biosynthesis protein ApbE [Novosphingobium sp. 12-64-8]
MASPCEVQVEGGAPELAAALGAIGEAEARRIEAKYTRYRPEGIVHQINTAQGAAVEVDEETAGLIDYAAQVHALSEGRFDVTSGVLRRVWTFDGSDRVPSRAAVGKVLALVGWGKVRWENRTITMPAGMEIDLGGICKEYAVDRAAQAIMRESDLPVLVNFGGDLRTTRAKAGGRWQIAIESLDPARTTGGVLGIGEGAIATSGDARRFLLRKGRRYSHILDPRTGFPVEGPPRSVTVAANTCLQAGTLSTLAMLKGKDAELFLKNEGVEAWVHW